MGFLQGVAAEARSTVSGPAVSSHFVSGADAGKALLKPSGGDAAESLGNDSRQNFLAGADVHSGADYFTPRTPEPSISPAQINLADQLFPLDGSFSNEGRVERPSTESPGKLFPPGEFNLKAENSASLHKAPPIFATEVNVPDQAPQLVDEQRADIEFPLTPLQPEVTNNPIFKGGQDEAWVKTIAPESGSRILEEVNLTPETFAKPLAVGMKVSAQQFKGSIVDSLTEGQGAKPHMADHAPLAVAEMDVDPTSHKSEPEKLKGVVEPLTHPPEVIKPDTPLISEDAQVRQVSNQTSEPVVKTLSSAANAQHNGNSGGGVAGGGVKPQQGVGEKNILHHVEKPGRALVVEDKQDRKPSVSLPKKVAATVPGDHGSSPVSQHIKAVLHQQMPDSVTGERDVAIRPETVARQAVYQNEGRAYYPAMTAPQPVNQKPEVKIGQVDVFIEGPQRSSGPAASSHRPTLGLTSRHFLRRI
jgi:hypothetical protein